MFQQFNQHEEIKKEIERIQKYRRSFAIAKLFFALFFILSIVGLILIFVFIASGDTSASQIIGAAAMSGIGGFGTLIMCIVIPAVYSKIYSRISSTPTVLIILGIFFIPVILIPIGLSIATNNMRQLQEMKESELRSYQVNPFNNASRFVNSNIVQNNNLNQNDIQSLINAQVQAALAQQQSQSAQAAQQSQVQQQLTKEQIQSIVDAQVQEELKKIKEKQ